MPAAIGGRLKAPSSNSPSNSSSNDKSQAAVSSVRASSKSSHPSLDSSNGPAISSSVSKLGARNHIKKGTTASCNNSAAVSTGTPAAQAPTAKSDTATDWSGADLHQPTEEECAQLLQDDAEASTTLSMAFIVRNTLVDDADSDAASAAAVVQSMTHLWLDRLRIAVMPPQVLCQLPAVTHLYLQHNRLTSLEAISSMTGLRFLCASHNRLDEVHSLSDCTRMQFLDLSHNRIASVNVHGLPSSLQCLQLAGNPCTGQTQLLEQLSQSLPELTYLDGPLDDIQQLDTECDGSLTVCVDDRQSMSVSGGSAVSQQHGRVPMQPNGTAGQDGSLKDLLKVQQAYMSGDALMDSVLSRLEAVERACYGVGMTRANGTRRRAAAMRASLTMSNSRPSSAPMSRNISSPLTSSAAGVGLSLLRSLSRGASGIDTSQLSSVSPVPAGTVTADEPGRRTTQQPGSGSPLPSSSRVTAGGRVSPHLLPSSDKLNSCAHVPNAAAIHTIWPKRGSRPASPAQAPLAASDRASSAGLIRTQSSIKRSVYGTTAPPTSCGAGGVSAASVEAQVHADLEVLRGRLQSVLQPRAEDVAAYQGDGPLSSGPGAIHAQLERMVADAKARINGQRNIDAAVTSSIHGLRSSSDFARMRRDVRLKPATLQTGQISAAMPAVSAAAAMCMNGNMRGESAAPARKLPMENSGTGGMTAAASSDWQGNDSYAAAHATPAVSHGALRSTLARLENMLEGGAPHMTRNAGGALCAGRGSAVQSSAAVSAQHRPCSSRSRVAQPATAVMPQPAVNGHRQQSTTGVRPRGLRDSSSSDDSPTEEEMASARLSMQMAGLMFKSSLPPNPFA